MGNLKNLQAYESLNIFAFPSISHVNFLPQEFLESIMFCAGQYYGKNSGTLMFDALLYAFRAAFVVCGVPLMFLYFVLSPVSCAKLF